MSRSDAAQSATDSLPKTVSAHRPRQGLREWQRRVMRRGGAAVLGLALAAGSATAQWRAGQDPGAGVATTAATLEDYTNMLGAAEARSRAALALLVAHGTREAQEGSMPPAQQWLLDEAHTAWVVVQNAPADFRGREVYEAIDRRFRKSIAVMRVARTPPAAGASPPTGAMPAQGAGGGQPR